MKHKGHFEKEGLKMSLFVLALAKFFLFQQKMKWSISSSIPEKR